MKENKKILNAKEVAQYLGIGYGKFLYMLNSNILSIAHRKKSAKYFEFFLEDVKKVKEFPITMKEAAKILGVDQQYLRKKIEKGEWKVPHDSSNTRKMQFYRSQVEEFYKSQFK